MAAAPPDEVSLQSRISKSTFNVMPVLYARQSRDTVDDMGNVTCILNLLLPLIMCASCSVFLKV